MPNHVPKPQAAINAHQVPKMYISGERGRALKARAITMNTFLAKARNTYCPRGVGDD